MNTLFITTRYKAMLSREQVNTILVLRKRENTIFSEFPVDLIREVIGWENGDIAQALKHAAYS